RRAAPERQFGRADRAAGSLTVVTERAPGGIELAEPVEEDALLSMDPREGLVEVVVGVDQAGHRDQAATVDDVRLLANRWTPLADPADGAAVDQDGTVFQLRAGVVHGDHDPATVEQDHEPARRRVAARWTASRIFW